MLLSFIFCAPLAAAADIFNYGAFTQTATYSLATQLGFFSAYNLNVIYHQVPNSRSVLPTPSLTIPLYPRFSPPPVSHQTQTPPLTQDMASAQPTPLC